MAECESVSVGRGRSLASAGQHGFHGRCERATRRRQSGIIDREREVAVGRGEERGRG